MNMVRKLTGVALLVPTLLMAHPAGAQEAYPTRPIKVVVPFAAGGATDQVARLLGHKVAALLGTSVVIENRPGANGNIGADYVAKSAPDGYTVLHSTSSLAFTAAFKQRVPYRLDRDLAPVSLLINQPLLIVAGPSLQARSMQEALAYAKANPGKLSYGSSGSGNLTHLAMHVLLKASGATATDVPYKGGASAFPNLLGGQIDLLLDPINSAYPFVRDGRARALAVTGTKRSALLPDVPTAAEVVLPGFEIGAWQAMMVPAGTPAAIVARLHSAYAQALADPEVRSRLAAQGAEAIGSTPEEFNLFLRKEIGRWERVVTESGIKVE